MDSTVAAIDEEFKKISMSSVQKEIHGMLNDDQHLELLNNVSKEYFDDSYNNLSKEKKEKVNKRVFELRQVDTYFLSPQRPISWHGIAFEFMKQTPSSDSVDFVVNPLFDFLLYTVLMFETPAIRVKESYSETIQIAWCNNLAHNVVERATHEFDDDILVAMDHVWYDIYKQFYLKKGMRKIYNECIGHVSYMINWTTELPEYCVSAPQPWSYSRSIYNSFPILRAKNKILHRYKLVRGVSSLLRMRKRERSFENPDVYGEWEDIEFNPVYVEGISNNEAVIKPRMYAAYIRVDPNERQSIICNGTFKFCTETVTSIDSTSEYTFGGSAPQELYGSTPGKCIYVLAENMDARKIRNLSNYTTNTFEIKKGWNPIHQITETRTGRPRFEKIPHECTSRITPFYHTTAPPTEKGYNLLTYNVDPTSPDSNSGVVLDNMGSKIVVNLKNTDPFLGKIKVNGIGKSLREDNSQPNFLIHVRIPCTVSCVYEYDSATSLIRLTINKN